MPLQETVALGAKSYHVVPQRIGRLRRELGKFLEEAGDLAVDENDVIGSLGGYAHRILTIFIPDLMPRWEWDGYGSEEDAENDHYDERLDQSPDPNQIAYAFKVGITLNRFDIFKHLKGVVGGDFFQAWARTAMAEVLPTQSSRSSSAAPTDGASSTSGTTESTEPETPTSD